MWRVTPIDLRIPRWNPGLRPLSSAYAVTAVGLLVAGCSASTAPAPSRSQASALPAPSSASSPGRTQVVSSTSSLAPLTLPQAVSRHTVFARGEGLLVVGRLTSADTTTQAILRVDLARSAVSPAGQLPVPVHDAAGTVVNARDLIFGGGSTAVTSAVQDVTPGSSPRVIGHLPQPRADLVAAGDGKAGYVLGGFDGAQGSTTILRTQDDKVFAVVGTLPVSVRYSAVAASGTSIRLFGGEHAGAQVTDVQQIDLRTGHGTIAGHLPGPLAHAGAFVLGGAIFVAGGGIGATAADKVMRFDPANMTFTAAGHLPAARSDFGVAVVSDTAYLVGGESPKPVDTVIRVRAQAGGTP
jgi:Kelch motif